MYNWTGTDVHTILENLDDNPFFGSPLTHLELELELFEAWDDGDNNLSHQYL